jgi:hypothetical protein
MRMLGMTFSNAEVDAFAKSLAREIAERCAPGEAERPEDKRGRRRLTRTLESVYSKAREYRREHRLGVYRKARLGNTFKWELKELGYGEQFVEETTKGLVLSISRD